MPRLKDRQRQIPNGLKFALPELGYQSAPFTSFDTIVNQVDNIVRANPGRAQAARWPTSRNEIAEWVDDFNARLCHANGWNDYITGTEDSPPKFNGPPPGRFHALAVGAQANAEFILSGNKPVNEEAATARAAVCVKCPLNTPGDFSNFFERATAEMLRQSIGAMHELKLQTPHDSQLGVCEACWCPLRLKIWFPLEYISKHLNPETKAALHPSCWVTAEEKAP